MASQTVSLAKGGNISLTKQDPDLRRITVGLGWDARETHGAPFDLDVEVFLLADDGKTRSPDDFIFYNNLRNADGSVVHTGDNLTGDGDGDDEQIKVDLAHVSEQVRRLVFCVTIHEAAQKRQNFGGVENAFIRVVNTETDREIARYDLTEDASTETSMIFAEVYRHQGEWKFKAVGQGFAGGLAALCAHFGIDAA
jgi:tellurium resistance protein TerD